MEYEIYLDTPGWAMGLYRVGSCFFGMPETFMEILEPSRNSIARDTLKDVLAVLGPGLLNGQIEILHRWRRDAQIFLSIFSFSVP